MFGYVTPCKMELKIKDYDVFKAYYCGVCHSIKGNIGNLPRMALSYDMTFLAILLDALDQEKSEFSAVRCFAHPLKKKLIIRDKEPMRYAAFLNTILTYYKLLDNVSDDNSLKSKLYSSYLKTYIKKMPKSIEKNIIEIEKKLKALYKLEKEYQGDSLDALSHPFADLTGYLLSAYNQGHHSDALYWLGYNLGKWIYIIDAYEDLEEDLYGKKFNALNQVFNKETLAYKEFNDKIENRTYFLLTTCAQQTLSYLNKLSLNKNKEILFNILQLGLMEKMDKVFKRSCLENEKSI